MGVARGVAAVAVVGVLLAPLVCGVVGASCVLVSARSMSPTLNPGDIVYLKSAASYQVGDVVRVPAETSALRRIVGALEDGTFVTCQDQACPDPDNRLAGAPDPDPISQGQIAGKVVTRIGTPWAYPLRWSATWPGRMGGAALCLALLWPWGERRRSHKGHRPRGRHAQVRSQGVTP